MKPYSRTVHWTALFLFICALPAVFYATFNAPQSSKAEGTYDFPRWEWVNPTPTGNTLNKAITCSDGTIWVAGSGGTILKSNNMGSTWQSSYSGTVHDLQDIVCINSSNILAIGDSGSLLSYNGLAWTSIVSGTTRYFESITAVDSTHALAVGATTGQIVALTYNGSTWSATNVVGGNNYYYSVTTVDSTHALAAGGVDRITALTYNGSSWIADTITTGAAGYFNAITAVDSTHALAVGRDGQTIALTYNGSTWSSATVVSGTTKVFYSIVKVDATHALAVGETGQITALTYNGSTWSAVTVTSGTTSYLTSVTIVDSTHALAIGGSGQITALTYNGPTWSATTVTNGTTNSLNSVAKVDATHALAVGGGGQITALTYNGSTWSTTTVSSGTTNGFDSITKVDATHALAVGETGQITALTYNGSTWSAATVASGTTNSLNSVTTVDSTHALAVGSTGQITALTYNGSTWSAVTVTSGTTKHLTSITTVDSTHTLAVGDVGQITALTYNGSTWSAATVASGTTVFFTSVAVVNSTHVLAVGNGGQITALTYNGSTWSAVTVINGTSIVFLSVTTTDPTHALAVGYFGQITALTYNGSSWSAATVTSSVADHFFSIVAVDSTHALVVGGGGQITALAYNGSAWSAVNAISQTSNILRMSVAISSSNILAVGGSGTILHYSSPPNATATKLLAALPGQSFADGTGITGTATAVKAGQSVTATIYAVDANNVLDKGNASIAGFTTTDPGDSNPAQVQLTQGGTCTQNRTDPSQSNCGIGTAVFSFHTPGTWTITASDTNGILTAGTSSSITVTAGSPAQIYSSLSSSSAVSGTASPAISLGLKDQFGNVTAAEADTTLTLSSSSSNGRFSTSSSGPWTATLNITIASGSQTSGSFYYLNYSAEASTITVSSSGLTSATISASTTVGSVDPINSSCSLSKSSETADNSSVGVTATLVQITGGVTNKISGKTVTISSLRSEDNIVQPSALTDGNGQAFGSIKSTKAGVTTITCKDETDGIFLSNTVELAFNPGPVSNISLLSSFKTVAGSPFSLKTSLHDKFGNTASNSGDTVTFSSTDSKAILPDPYKYLSLDGGSHTFDSVVLKSAGNQTITAKDKETTATGEAKIEVSPAAFSITSSSLTSTKDKLVVNKEKATLKTFVSDDFGNGLSDKDVTISFNPDYGDLKINIGRTGSSGLGEFEFTPKKVGSVVFSAYNETDKAQIGSPLTIEVLPDTILGNLSSFVDILQNNATARNIANFTQNVVAVAGVLGLLPLIANILGSAPAALHALNYGVSLTLETFGIRRKRKSWGRVFNSTNGKGVDMAMVRLYDQGTMRLVSTVVTDEVGRYSFHPKEGNYILSVSKEKYVFPTEIFAKYGLLKENKKLRAELTERYYIGQVIKIDKKNPNLNIDVPIDLVKAKAPLFLKIKLYASDFIDLIAFSLAGIFIPLLLLGSLLSLFTAVILPTKKNLVFAVIYIVVILIYLISRAIRQDKYGFVYDEATKKPIAGAFVSVFDKEYNSQKETQVTDAFGRFTISVLKGNYYLIVQKAGYEFSDREHKSRKKESFFSRFDKYKNHYRGQTLSYSKNKYVNVSVAGQKKTKD